MIVVGIGCIAIGVQPKGKETDLCALPRGAVERVEGQVIGIKEGIVPNQMAVRLGSFSSPCTVIVTTTRSQVNFVVGEMISVEGVTFPYGVRASKIERLPYTGSGINRQIGINIVEGKYSKYDVIHTDKNSYKIDSSSGLLSLSNAQVNIINQYSKPTKLRLTFNRSSEVIDIEEVNTFE